MRTAEGLNVLVDMDMVVANFAEGITSRIQSRYPDIQLVERRRHFYIAQEYPEHYDLIRSLADEEGFFESLPLVDDAVEGCQRLVELGYRFQFCSTPLESNVHCIREKNKWIERHFVPVFGHFVVESAIFTPEKHQYDGVALIDDNNDIKNADAAVWQQILFAQEYNQGTQLPTMFGWLDESLPELLDDATRQYHLKK